MANLLSPTAPELMMANLVNVFVYGTLRPPQPNTTPADSRYYPEVARCVKTVTPAWLPAADVFDAGSYPAIIRGSGVVYGELLGVQPRALEIMDRIEGHPTFYKRERVQVETDHGPEAAWVYWAPRGLVIGRPQIINGDWLHRQYAAASEPRFQPAIDPRLLALVRRFAQADCCWLSTVRPDDRAHSAPVWHVWLAGRVYVVSQPDAVKIRNLQHNPSVVVTHPDPVNPIIIEGWGTVVPTHQDKLRPLFKDKYDWDIQTDTEYNSVIEITPLKLMTWGKYGDGRWPGEDVLQVYLA